eukprot:gene13218-19055_t
MASAAPPVFELLGHLRDDGKMQPLIKTLEDLAARVQAAELSTHGNPTTQTRAREPGPEPKLSSSPSLATMQSGGQRTLGAPPSSKAQSSQILVKPPASQKVEDSQLPAPCPGQPLAGPEGAHAWEALQAMVNETCSNFETPGGKVSWKKWALNLDNVSVVVSLFWWTVAQVFKPDHPLAAKVKEHAYVHFAHQYVECVLRRNGVNKDRFHALWQTVIVEATMTLLQEVYHRSAHKMDSELQHFVFTQVQRWISGHLPSDLHPSMYATVGDNAPAAFSQYRNAGPAGTSGRGEEGGERVPSTRHRFDAGASSGVMSHVFSKYELGAPGQAGSNLGRRSSKLGAGQYALRRPLDESANAELSYRDLAKQCKQNAQEARDKYEKSKNTSQKEIAAMRREWVETRNGMEAKNAQEARDKYEKSKKTSQKEIAAMRREWVETKNGMEAMIHEMSSQQSRVRDMSHKISQYIENDIDRILNGHPTSLSKPPVLAAAVSANHLESIMARQDGGEEASTEGAKTKSKGSDRRDRDGAVSQTRIMAPWSKMRNVERNISSALSQKRHTSTDAAAHLSAMQKKSDEPRRGQKWSPAAIDYTRGTLDTRLGKASRAIMGSIDMELYANP